ncbi:Class V chitinase CHIT5 [Camellia lanceoleosa]|uniref:Class V chitinase CHIT5 n=1 Tax=Camellia lanceoleosa TaxID=1840588 RepID=A0ACC0I438_9ERIC|nr:Class V chitinase CHIT5 [Camellia lanceoleosa]
MCYDYHGSWDTSVTGAQALLFNKSGNVSTSYGILTWVENGVPPEKLVMGPPMYGRTWKLKDPIRMESELLQMGQGLAIYGS